MSKRGGPTGGRSGGAAGEAEGPDPGGDPFAPTWLAGALLVAAAVLAFFPSLGGGFLWDDVSITGYAALQSPGGLARIWLHPGEIPNEEHYWPLTYTSFWLETQLFGLKPLVFRLTNLLLHCANALLVWGLLRRLRVAAAWPVALVFAVHPMRVESVAWIIERKDVLSGLFYLAGLHCGLRWLDRGGSEAGAMAKRNWPWLVGVAACLIAGMLSKSVVFSLPIVFALLVLWRRGGRISRGEWLGIGSLLLLAIALVLLDFRWMATNQFTYATGHGPLARVVLVGRVAWAYVGLTLMPADLVPQYPRWPDTVSPPAWQWAFPIAALAVPVGLWVARRRVGVAPVVAALAYAVLLGPMLGLLDFSFQRHTFIADRFTYLASIPLLALVLGPLFSALAAGNRPAPPAARWAVAVAIAAPLVFLAARYSAAFSDDERFYRTILARNESSWMARNNLGTILKDRGQLEEAAQLFEEAIRLNPSLAEAYINLGELHSRLGHVDVAIQHLVTALRLEPQSYEARVNLGVTLARAGRMKEAIKMLRSALELNPTAADVTSNLGNALVSDRQVESGTEMLRRAIALAPQDPIVLFRSALGLLSAGQIAEARATFARALELERARGNAEGIAQNEARISEIDGGRK